MVSPVEGSAHLRATRNGCPRVNDTPIPSYDRCSILFDIQSPHRPLSLEGDHDSKPLFTQWDEVSWGNTPAVRSVQSSTCNNVPIVVGFGAEDVFYANACMEQSAGTMGEALYRWVLNPLVAA